MASVNERFAGKVAIITGGASGIGRALAEELARHGGRVILADINADAAEATSRALPAGAASAAPLDVTDAEGFERLVGDVRAAHGRIDYLFNNAGIFIGGDAARMTLDDWRRLIDVNLRGVVHGIAAAYPVMRRQGFGHLVNTASAAGLAPTPGATAYAMTKHAVVGLSTSLRGEAAAYGVKVSVVCPGFIDTPIKDTATLLGADRDAVIRSLPVALYPAAACACDILRGVARNRPIIVVTRSAKVGWWLYRLAPGMMTWLTQAVAQRNPLLRPAGGA
jgi:NAD(P)-dependent dehydrogenase (short-subunit alcohol dehydrogenase family)